MIHNRVATQTSLSSKRCLKPKVEIYCTKTCSSPRRTSSWAEWSPSKNTTILIAQPRHQSVTSQNPDVSPIKHLWSFGIFNLLSGYIVLFYTHLSLRN